MSREKAEQAKRNREIIKLIRLGLSYAKIGRQFGLTRERVRQIGVKALVHNSTC